MTRFIVDAPAVIRIAAQQIEVGPGHTLLAPTLLRSQVLSTVHESVHCGEMSTEDGRALIKRIDAIKIRLLGDGVLRRLAWKLADELGQAPTYQTEYIALTRLQGDALLALDDDLARLATGLVELATITDLQR